MKRFLAIAALMLAVPLSAAGTSVLAQEATPDTSSCGGVPAIFEGPSTRTLHDVQIELPEGNYTHSIAPPGSPGLPFGLCHIETGAGVTLSGETCQELERDAATGAGEAIVDAIVDSCEIAPASPTPAMIPGQPPICASDDSVGGGSTVTVEDLVEVTLPEGEFVVEVAPDDTVLICNPQEGYALTVRAYDCRRTDITPPNDPQQDVKDAILASCVPINPATPTPIPESAQNPDIRPPTTGDAGLASTDGKSHGRPIGVCTSEGLQIDQVLYLVP